MGAAGLGRDGRRDGVAELGPGPNPAALALGLGAILLARRSPAGAGTLAGVAAAFRLELGAAAALGALVAAAERAGPGLRAPWVSREGVRALGTAVLVAALALGCPSWSPIRTPRSPTGRRLLR